MAVTVVDGTNLQQVMEDAGVEVVNAPEKKDDPKEDAKPDIEAKGKEGEPKPDPEAEDADDVEGDDGLTARQKRDLSAQMLKAIGKKHRAMKEAEEFAAHQYKEKAAAEARAADLESQIKEMQAKLEPVKEAKEPQREDFDTDSAFMKASIQWGVDQGIRQREAEMQERQRQANVQAQYKRAASLVPDFEQAVETRLNYPGAVVGYMQESEMFAELGYHFAKNPKVLERLVSLTPARQLVEVGKIEATLKPFGSSESSSKDGDKPNGQAKPAPSTQDTGFSPSKARSDAPVIKPLTSNEGSQVEPDVREMDTRQMIEQFQKTQKVNLHARKRH